MNETILQLIVSMGPESSGALQFYIIAELIGSLISLVLWGVFMYIIYLITTKVIQVLAYDPVTPIRKITHPYITGPVSESEINDIVDVIKTWKIKARQLNKQVEKQNSYKEQFS